MTTYDDEDIDGGDLFGAFYRIRSKLSTIDDNDGQ
jgi:hypothetical protein